MRHQATSTRTAHGIAWDDEKRIGASDHHLPQVRIQKTTREAAVVVVVVAVSLVRAHTCGPGGERLARRAGRFV